MPGKQKPMIVHVGFSAHAACSTVRCVEQKELPDLILRLFFYARNRQPSDLYLTYMPDPLKTLASATLPSWMTRKRTTAKKTYRNKNERTRLAKRLGGRCRALLFSAPAFGNNPADNRHYHEDQNYSHPDSGLEDVSDGFDCFYFAFSTLASAC